MKILSYFSAYLLVFTLSACSSDSNKPVTLVTNTNEPAQNSDSDSTNQPSDDESENTGNTEDGSADSASDGNTDNDAGNTDATGAGNEEDNSTTSGNNESDSAGNNDTSGNTSGGDSNDTDSEADGADGNDSDGGSDSADNSTTAGNNDTDGEGDTAGSSGSDGGSNGDANDDSGSGGSDTGGASDDSHDDEDPGPKIDPNTVLGQMVSRINELAVRSLFSLNQSLNQGEMLTEQQEQCLGSYDPAIGEPVLSINCEQPLATGDVPIFTSIATLVDSAKCRTSLQENEGNACNTSQADLLIRTTFITPEVGRPQPRAGATLSYNIVEDQLIIENLPQALSGRFFCVYNSRNGHPIDNQDGSCDNQLTRLTDLIDDLLSIER